MVDLVNGDKEISVKVRFVFIGVGGGVLKLLQMFGIFEVEGYVGFLVGGLFFVIINLDVVKCYLVKVYGKVLVGLLLMLVLYFDICMIDGKLVLLFGLFVIFFIKFLKNGLLWDLLGLVISGNIGLMFNVGIDNFDFSQYLIGQLMFNQDDCMVLLCEYFLEVCDEDWKLVQVGQCVQIIKKDVEKGGVL